MQPIFYFEQAMKQELIQYKDVVNSVQLLSKQVVPLKERKMEMRHEKDIKAVCDYQQSAVSRPLLSYAYFCVRKCRISHCQKVKQYSQKRSKVLSNFWKAILC